MKLIYETPMLAQIESALEKARSENKTVKGIEITRAEFARVMCELGPRFPGTGVSLQGNALYGYPLKVTE